MKVFFALLLLTNIVFALIQWLVPYERLINKPQPLMAAQQLVLLQETEPRQSAVSRQRTQSQQETDIATPSVPDKLCYTLGPFKDQQKSQEVALKFKQNNISINSRSSLEKEYMGMMVFVDQHETRGDAIRTAESLAAKGIRDYIIVSEPDRANILSLGVFSLKKNADRRLQAISKLGYAVKSEARYRNRTIYWLDYSETENENLTRFIDQLKTDQGISRISRQCNE